MNALHDTYLLGYRRPGASRAPLVDDSTRDPICPETGGVLEAAYDLDAAGAALDRDSFGGGARMWTWRALLPVRDPARVCSLDEGGTPLLHIRRLGEALGLQCLYLKDESRNPTGSFKDRGASVTVSKCREVGHRGLTVASSGNLACSLSSYAAAAGLEFHGFIREDTSATNLLHGIISQQHFYIVPGDMLEGTALAAAVAKRYHFFHAVQPYNLFRVEGKKTLAFEICAQLGWRVPDRVLVPTSGCTNALALHKGFSELRALGWIATLPAIDLVQAEGCAPVVDAFEAGAPVSRSRGPGTALLGMGHPHPSAGDAAVEVMRVTGGVGYCVADQAAFEAQRHVAKLEGLFLQPASVTPIAALAALDEATRARLRGQTIVWIGTGTGKNQIEAPLAQCLPPPRLGDLGAFAKLNPTLADSNGST